MSAMSDIPSGPGVSDPPLEEPTESNDGVAGVETDDWPDVDESSDQPDYSGQSDDSDRSDLPLVAIVGRPNVGKSTLLNRIIGRREAIVEERPGVTRDRKEVEAEWLGRHFRLVDTGGWLASGTALDDKVSAQSEAAIAEATALLFVVDAQAGLVDEDAEVARLIRREETPVLVVANKVDATAHEYQMWDFMTLGLGEPHPISSLHGRGTGDLLDALLEILPEQPVPVEPDAPLTSKPHVRLGDRDEVDGQRVFSVALAGRPNVGKSTLFNRLLGEERSVVHDMPGTTRDSVDTVVDTDYGPIRFVDTAGMRRRSRVDAGTEYFSMVRALKSVDRSNVALLVIDATEGITHQDQRLAERIDGAGCPIVVLLNKWELLDAEERADLNLQVERKLHFIGEDQVQRISALTGKGVSRLLPTLMVAVDEYSRRIPTRKVNQVIRAAQQAQPAPKGARVLYATQGATDPPTFTLFTNRTVPPTYLRYLERSLREAFDMEHTPIKLRVRRRD